MSELKDKISPEFYNGDHVTPRVGTVGELIEQLKRLPKDLALSGWPERFSHEVVVYNISSHNTHLTIEEVDQD